MALIAFDSGEIEEMGAEEAAFGLLADIWTLRQAVAIDQEAYDAAMDAMTNGKMARWSCPDRRRADTEHLAKLLAAWQAPASRGTSAARLCAMHEEAEQSRH